MLKEISQHDLFYRQKAYAICRDKFEADDLVQEMYLKLHRYDQTKLKQIVEKGVVKFICIRIINQIFLDGKRKKTVEYPNENINIFADFSKDIDKIDTIKHIRSFFDELYWFDSRLFDEYVSNDVTMRQLSDETGIPLRTIWAAINRAKNKLKEITKHECFK
jgi:DNA-directed RNA polymerase specialized sigma24 family protein